MAKAFPPAMAWKRGASLWMTGVVLGMGVTVGSRMNQSKKRTSVAARSL